MQSLDARRQIRALEVADRELWVLAVLFFGVGDLLTTGIGLSVNGVSEIAPVVKVTITHYGLLALVLLKVLGITWAYALWTVVPRPYRVGIPLGLTIIGIPVTAWNVHVVLVAVLP
jgi:hypothetical protein